MKKATRTYKLKRFTGLADEHEITAFVPMEYVVEGSAACDSFWLAAETFNALGGPDRIVVTVKRAKS